MSSVEHTATVDKGLKMKIKRKNLGQSSHKTDQKHEIVKSEKDACKAVSNSDGSTPQTTSNSNGLVEKSTKHCLLSERGDKSPMKMKGSHKGDKKGKEKEKGKTESGNILNGGTSCAGPSVSNGLDVLFSQVSMEPRVGETAQMKREKTINDPYEFNAKVEDAGSGIELPMKKMKSEKIESASSPMQTSCSDIGVETSTVGVSTDPDCLGPCEPGTSITLEGLVWHETENGVLVVNVTWRGKTYVGTLLDATRYDWAPPRFNCESPVSDFETRTPKGRGKRIRGAAGTPVNEKTSAEGRRLRNKARRGSNASFQAPPSPARSDVSVGGVKRKGRPPELDLSDSAKVKRCRSSSRGTPGTESPSPVLIECPEPNCNKKYKHINGLRYHQTHAHQNPGTGNQEDDEDDGDDTDAPTPPVTRAGKKTTSGESERNKDKSPIDKDNEDNIPLNEIAASNKAKAAAAAAAAAASAASSCNQEKNSPKNESNKTDSTKSEPTSGLAKKKDTPVTSTVTPVSTSAKVSVPSTQVYQISGAPMACLGGVAGAVVTQAVPVVTTTIAVSSPAAAPIPIAVTAIATAPQAADIIKSEANKDKNDKLKPRSATRPIVPAPPPPQMIALSSSVTVTHSNSSPVSTHTQMSPSLKPIQPKPTIMGEPSLNHQALSSLKEKKPKPKKPRKDKEGSNGSAIVNNNKQMPKDQVLKDDQSKCERPPVIKNAPCPSRPGETPPRKDNIVPILETPRTSHETQRPNHSGPSVIATQGLVKSVEQQQQAARLTQPPNLLKVNSPLRVTTPDHDRKTPVTEDVQSPAYSDISDANESGSPQQNESPKKDEISVKKEKVSTPQGAQGDGSMPPHYGMYSNYYGQQYMMQNVGGSHMSPSTPKAHMAGQDGASVSDDKKQPPVFSDRKMGDKKLEDKDDGKLKPEIHGAPHPSQQMHPDYQQYVQQMYAQIQNLPRHAQYQCLAAYGLIDRNQYHMHMMSQDPHARQQYEKAAAEHHLQQEQGLKDSEGPNKQSTSRPSSREHGSQQLEHSKQSQQQQQAQTHGGPQMMSTDRLHDLKKTSMLDKQTERDIRDQSLREKQNENHQILKENIELKSQMDPRPRHYDSHMPYDYRSQDQELRRLQMFQQQKMYEQQKRKMELSSEPPELTSADSGSKKQAVGRPDGPKTQDQFRDVKKEVIDARKSIHGHDSMGKMNTDVKSMDDKSRSSDKHRGPLDVSKPKPHSMPVSVSSSTPSSSVSTSTPTSQNASYQPYLQYPYMQSHYGHMPFDPNNPMYRAMNPQVIGYSGTPYLHSPQLGYSRVGGAGGGEAEKEKLDSSMNKSSGSVNAEPSESESKNVESVPQGSQYYSNVHKIHELGDRGRPSPHRASPVPAKSASGESPGTPLQVHPGSSEKARDYSNSPPTQRHLHTHHHTHVVSGFPPMYDTLPYNGKSPMLVSHPAAAAAMQHPYPPK